MVELPAHLSAGQLTGPTAAPRPAPPGPGGAGVPRPVPALSMPAQTLMLLAAADDSLPPRSCVRAGPRRGRAPETSPRWRASGLLRSRGRPGRGPAPAGPLRGLPGRDGLGTPAAHAALRALTSAGDTDHDRDRQTWHQAAAADGPDEDVAAELEAVGARAESRGGHEAAARAYERAAQLTPPTSCARTGCSPPPATPTPPAGPSARQRCSDRHARSPTTSCCAPTSTGSAAASRSSSAPPSTRTASSSAPPATSPRRPGPGAGDGRLAGVLRSHGVDSGATLPPGTSPPRSPPATRRACGPQTAARTTERKPPATGAAPSPRCGPPGAAWPPRTATCGRTWATWRYTSATTAPTGVFTTMLAAARTEARSWRSSTP